MLFIHYRIYELIYKLTAVINVIACYHRLSSVILFLVISALTWYIGLFWG